MSRSKLKFPLLCKAVVPKRHLTQTLETFTTTTLCSKCHWFSHLRVLLNHPKSASPTKLRDRKFKLTVGSLGLRCPEHELRIRTKSARLRLPTVYPLDGRCCLFRSCEAPHTNDIDWLLLIANIITEIINL